MTSRRRTKSIRREHANLEDGGRGLLENIPDEKNAKRQIIERGEGERQRKKERVRSNEELLYAEN